MSHQTLDILFGVTGQSLYFDAPEGRPSSVTTSSVFETTVGDDGTAESATTGSAAVETTPNTTFNAASGDGQADPRKCNLTATTGCAIGRRYLAKNALGETEFVEVTGISSGVYVQARQPLQNAYTTADTFASTRITHAIDSTWVADSTNLSQAFDPNPRYRWRLVYVVSSVTYIHDAYLDLVRYAARYDVTGLDVERRFGGWLRVVGTFEREDQGASVIAEAFQRVKFDLYNLGVADQSVRNREVVNELVKFCAGAMVFDDEQHWKLYQDRLSQLVAWGKTNLATDSSGASGPADVRPLWRR
jgi:hypothetical protein